MGIIVFAGLTAYDTQKIKGMNVPGNQGTDAERKTAIFGALGKVVALLVTSGVYGVIRRPSYLGLLVNSLGWALAAP